MEKYGCIGKKLTHSFSKEIHKKLGSYNYELIELAEEEVAPFLEKKDFKAINVTIPYKQTVMPHLDFISNIAKQIGAVNTVVNKDGRLYGYNTDYHGIKALIKRLDISLKGKKVLVLGTGGTGKTAALVARDMGAYKVITVSRNKTNEHINYDEAVKYHSDAQIIINTTPVGMYPNCDQTPINLFEFHSLEGVVDAVYNPLSTNFVLDAREKGVKAEGGLYMLVMQAIFAVEFFMDTKIPKERAEEIFSEILLSKENIVLTGMPGSGKSTVGRLIRLEGYTFIDTDLEIERRCGCKIKDIFKTKGEEYFRHLESEVIREISRENRQIISTGGGAVLRKENVRNLKQNGKIFFLDANLSRLGASEDRPLSSTDDKLKNLYNQRIDIYKSTADVTIPSMETAEMEGEYILKNRF